MSNGYISAVAALASPGAAGAQAAPASALALASAADLANFNAQTAVGIALRAEALRRASVGQMPPRPIEPAERVRSSGAVGALPSSSLTPATAAAYRDASDGGAASAGAAATGAFASSMRYAAALAMSEAAQAGYAGGAFAPGSAGRSTPNSSSATVLQPPDAGMSAVTRTTSSGLASPPRPPVRSGYSSQIAQGALAGGGAAGSQADLALRRARVSRRRTSLPSPAVLTASQLAAAAATGTFSGASSACSGAEDVGFTVPSLSSAQLVGSAGSLPASPATFNVSGPAGSGMATHGTPIGTGSINSSCDASPTRKFSGASSEPCSGASSMHASPDASHKHPHHAPVGASSTASAASGASAFSPSGSGEMLMPNPPTLLRTSSAGTIRAAAAATPATPASTATPGAPASGAPSPYASGQGQGRRTTWSWDAGLAFTPTEGAGVSACEEAGYTWGSAERGVRGKAGTPGFWAPEMLYYEKDGKGRRYDAAADWWSLGCLIYALLASRGPFTIIGGDTADDNAATLQNEPDLSAACFSANAASLLRGLLEKDPTKRLGSGPGGAAEVMAHPFFAGVDWVAIKNKQLRPPFKPMMNVLESTKPVRGWNEKDKAKLAATTVSTADQVRSSVDRFPVRLSLPTRNARTGSAQGVRYHVVLMLLTHRALAFAIHSYPLCRLATVASTLYPRRPYTRRSSRAWLCANT